MVNDSIQFSILGLDSVLGKFEQINLETRFKSGRASLRKAAKIIEANLKQSALALDDAETGRSIADNVALRWNGRLFKSTGDLGFRVGIMKGALTPKRGQAVDKGVNAPTPHWRLLEFGTENMRAQPFARRALADNISEVTNTFVNEFDRALDRAIKRARKKATNL